MNKLSWIDRHPILTLCIILVVWCFASDDDYLQAKQLECATADSVYQPRTDKCISKRTV